MTRVPDVADAMRITMDAYVRALSTAMAFLRPPPEAGPPANAAVEQWLRLARMTKEGLITAIEQGFDVWEREYRRAMSGTAAAPAPPPAGNPFAAWIDNWKSMVESLTGSARSSDAWTEQARRQAEAMQKSLEEGWSAWQRLWQPPSRSA